MAHLNFAYFQPFFGFLMQIQRAKSKQISGKWAERVKQAAKK